MMTNALELKGVSKRFGSFALEDISFSLPQGYIMGLIGVNGAGKSTLLKIILDIVIRDQGDVYIFGKDTNKSMVEIKQDIGFVFDENHFYGHITCDEMKRIIAPFYRNWDEEKYQSYMKRFDLPANKKIQTFSKGMKMQYNIVVALSHRAKFIMMDEPTAGLDPIVRRDLLNVLQEEVMKEEISVLFSTHVTSDLEKVADYITFIQNGKIAFSKEKDQLLEEYCLVKGDNAILNEENSASFIHIEKNRHGFQALSKDKGEIRLQFGDEVLIERATLEDIMYFSTQRIKS